MSLEIREQGDANEYAVMDQPNHWLAVIRFNGELSLARQRAIASLWSQIATGAGLAWMPADRPPPVDETVACLAGESIYFARVVNREGDWIESDRDGSLVFGRDGSPAYVSPHCWCEIPKGDRS